MKNKFLRSLSLFLAITIVCSSLMMLTSCASNKKDLTTASDENYINFTDGFTESKVTDEKSALKAVEDIAPEIGITDVEKELKVASVNTVGGDKYYRMQQYYEGYPVYGRTVVLAANGDGQTSALTSNTKTIKEIDIKTAASEESIKNSIENYYEEEIIFIDKITKDKLYIYDLEKNSVPRLVYVISVVTVTGAYNTIIDADSSKVITTHSTLFYDQKQFKYNGQEVERSFYASAEDGTNQMTYISDTGTKINVFIPKSTEKYTWYNDNAADLVTWKDGESPDKSAVDAISNMIASYKFYKDVFGIDSFDGEKSTINTYVHVMGYQDYEGEDHRMINNAFHWYSPNGTVFAFTKRYNDSGNEINEYSANLDVVAHEYTHGIESHISGMIYRGESGAIMEAYSDIFGEMVEDYSNDGVLDNDCNWILGDRNMINPISKGYPDCYKGENWVDTTQYNNDHGGVHTNNTVLSHAVYLMSNGINGTPGKKISNDQLAELWFRGLQLLQSDATFRQCANAILSSAQQMFQNDPKNFTVEKLECVQEAFNKVGISANVTTATWVEKGAKIYAVDSITNKLYDNYHIKFEKLNLETRKTELVSEADVTDANGYVINLPADNYIVTVSDNDPEGSKNEFSKTIKVTDLNSDEASRSSITLNKTVLIYTDFWAKTFVTDFTIPTDMMITLGELGVIEPEITPTDADSYSIKWLSSNETVATVSPNGEAGIITTLAKGKATITAELTSGGKTITKTTNLTVASKARDTVLVLDISGSMYGEPLQEMKKSAIQFCNDLLKDEYNNRVGIVLYDHEVTTIPLTADLNLLVSEIEQIQDGGRTDMEAGLATAESMLKNHGRAEAIKNVVVMADGIPNEGKTSNSGSLPLGETYSRYTGSIIYANAVIDTAKRMQKSYNVYSLGFFHDLDGNAKDFAVALMKEVASKPEDYHQVDKAENLQFAFGDISDDISAGSKIVINIACPVDVKVTYGNETLSSANDSFCNTASFGTLQLLGKNKDIKVITVDSDKDYNIEIVGTGDGKMDYSVNYFNEQEQLVDYRSFETVPITKTTVIKSNTNNDNAVDLNIDKDGDGENDEVWTADVKSKGAVVEDKDPDSLNSVISSSSEPSSSDSENSEAEGNNNVGVGIGLTVTALVVLILVVAGVVVVVVIIIVIIFATRSKKKKTLKQNNNNMQNIPISSYQQEVNTNNQTAAKTLISVQENITQAAPRMVGTIEFISGPMTGFAVPIKDGETLFIGKDPKFANIVIDSVYTKVSRRHCSITYDARTERYYVVDSSLNGTYLKGVTQLTNGERVLIDVNSILLLGDEECAILLK